MEQSEYKKLLRHILDKGYKKEDRTGVGTISTFGYQCRFNLQDGFPIVTEKQTAFKMAITELIWMIGGWMKLPEYEGYQRTNIKFLLDNKCKIWTEWPYKAYVNFVNSIQLGETIDGYLVTLNESPKIGEFGYRAFTQQEFEQQIMSNKHFALRFGDLGPVYQKQWRNFEGKKNHIDQLQEMIDKLKNKPDDRRNLSSYWNPTELNEMLLPPCHMMHQVWTRELSPKERWNLIPNDKPLHKVLRVRPMASIDDIYDEIEYSLTFEEYDYIPKRAISLQMYQRSSDCFLGVPFDWVWYAALTHMLADLTNMVVGEFIWVSGDTHLYLNSLDETNQVLERETFPFPQFKIKRKVDHIEDYVISDFELIDYKYGPPIKVAVAV